MKKLRSAVLALAGLGLLLGVAAGLSGCAGRPAAGSSASPSAASSVPVVAPTIVLVAPGADAKVAAGDVSISVTTTGLKFVMPSNTDVAGEGHVHFTLDGEPFKMSVKPDYVYAGVTPGPHTLKAELVQNDTKSFNPPVEQEITFVAE